MIPHVAGTVRELLVIVEGREDQRRIELLLPPEEMPNGLLIAAGAAGVEASCRTLETGFTRPFLGVRDRDLMDEEKLQALSLEVPSLFVLPSRCLENELLHPPLLTHVLDMLGHRDMPEERVRAVLREIADEQKAEVAVELAELDLYAKFELSRERDQKDTPAEAMARRFRAKRDLGGEHVSQLWGCLAEAEAALEKRWEREHLNLMDGKRALHIVGQRAATGVKAQILEKALIRRALDDPPPGVARLRDAMRQRASP
jgi:hypothetical protein